MPLFSVVVPTYNRLPYLPITLRSVWDQDFHDFELIIVDDGSNDETCEWLDQQTAPMKILRQQNLGPGAARNLGIRNASGDYVAFLDSDDLWFPWTLSCYAKIIAEFDQPAMVASKYMSFSDVAELSDVKNTPVQACFFANYFSSADEDISVGSGTVAIRRKVLQANEGFLEDRLNAEDHDLVMRLGEDRGFVQITQPIMLAWRRHPESESGDKSRTAAGVLRLLRRECQGVYPGDESCLRQRRTVLTRHARAAAVACLQSRQIQLGWLLYLQTFNWHIGLRRWKFLIGFPLMVARAVLLRQVGRFATEAVKIDHDGSPKSSTG